MAELTLEYLNNIKGYIEKIGDKADKFASDYMEYVRESEELGVDWLADGIHKAYTNAFGKSLYEFLNADFYRNTSKYADMNDPFYTDYFNWLQSQKDAMQEPINNQISITGDFDSVAEGIAYYEDLVYKFVKYSKKMVETFPDFYAKLLPKVSGKIFTQKTLKLMGVKGDDIVKNMWMQVQKLSPVKVSDAVSVNDKTFWFTLGNKGKWLNKIIMSYDYGSDTYDMKFIRINNDINAPRGEFGQAYEVKDGWTEGLYWEDIKDYINVTYGRRDKLDYVPYEYDAEKH